ncbi:MAG: magnesium transporter, partial [Clostridiales bacterium]|nr:magnesium transporter [Clostridiales bacterium]
ITGWYGMNFVYMPELQWRYGYFAVIMISLIIVIAEIIYFKNKKFF